MKTDGLQYFSDTHLVTFGLLIFFISFFVIIGLQWLRMDKQVLNKVSQLPFDGIDSSKDAQQGLKADRQGVGR